MQTHRILLIINFLLAENAVEEPRVLGLAMVPGKYIVSISIDDLMTAQNNTPCYGT